MTVRLPTGAKPSLIVADQHSLRPALEQAVIEKDGDGWVLTATDSYRAIRLPVEVSGDEQPHMVPGEALKRLEARDWDQAAGWTCDENGQVEISHDTIIFKRPEVGKTRDDGLPTWLDKVRPPALPRKRDQFTVGLNAKLLVELAEALGAVGTDVYITFDLSQADRQDGKNSPRAYVKPLRVEPSRGATTGAVGLQMPLRPRDL